MIGTINYYSNKFSILPSIQTNGDLLHIKVKHSKTWAFFFKAHYAAVFIFSCQRQWDARGCSPRKVRVSRHSTQSRCNNRFVHCSSAKAIGHTAWSCIWLKSIIFVAISTSLSFSSSHFIVYMGVVIWQYYCGYIRILLLFFPLQ